jgi:hypothetical protein
LVSWRFGAIAVSLAAAVSIAAAQTGPLPSLSVEVWSTGGKVAPGADGFIDVPNNERIRTRVFLRVRAVSDLFEDLEIQANQHPDYFKNRPPPNLTLHVRQRAPDSRTVPIRITSSGGGKDLTIYDVDTTFDILEPPEVREGHVREFLTWQWDYLNKASPNGVPYWMADKSGFMTQVLPVYTDMYINNPVGTYEVAARYAPSTAQNWRGVLTSSPLKVRVSFKADFFDVLRGDLKK